MDGRTRAGRTNRPRGFTIAELLAVLAIGGIILAVGIPLVAEKLREAEIRGAADQFTMSLRAARMIAVSKHATVDVDVAIDPDNFYEYTDAFGNLRHIDMPNSVQIVSSTDPISFQSNGSVAAAAVTVIEASLSGGVIDRWTVTTPLLGVATITHERIGS